MKNLLLAASAALFSFAAVAQTGPASVTGKTPTYGRAYGQAVSTAAQAKNDKSAKSLTDAEKDAYKAQQDTRKDAYKAREEARKDAGKDQQEARKDAYKAREEARKDAGKDQQEARKDAYKAQHEAHKDADKLVKHERSARGEHAHGGDHMSHAKPAKMHKMK